MKTFLFLTFVLVACNSNSTSKNAPSTDVDRATQLRCDEDFGTCTNRCHHIGGTNGEEYDCHQACKAAVKRCGH